MTEPREAVDTTEEPATVPHDELPDDVHDGDVSALDSEAPEGESETSETPAPENG